MMETKGALIILQHRTEIGSGPACSLPTLDDLLRTTSRQSVYSKHTSHGLGAKAKKGQQYHLSLLDDFASSSNVMS